MDEDQGQENPLNAPRRPKREKPKIFQIREEEHRLTIEIIKPWSKALFFFSLVWLTLWGRRFGTLEIYSSIAISAIGLFCLYKSLRTRESIVLDGQRLRRQRFGFGLFRAQNFNLEHIQNLRVVEKYRLEERGFHFAFEYKGRKRRLGIRLLTLEEAQQVVTVMERYTPVNIEEFAKESRDPFIREVEARMVGRSTPPLEQIPSTEDVSDTSSSSSLLTGEEDSCFSRFKEVVRPLFGESSDDAPVQFSFSRLVRGVARLIMSEAIGGGKLILLIAFGLGLFRLFVMLLDKNAVKGDLAACLLFGIWGGILIWGILCGFRITIVGAYVLGPGEAMRNRKKRAMFLFLISLPFSIGSMFLFFLLFWGKQVLTNNSNLIIPVVVGFMIAIVVPQLVLQKSGNGRRE